MGTGHPARHRGGRCHRRRAAVAGRAAGRCARVLAAVHCRITRLRQPRSPSPPSHSTANPSPDTGPVRTPASMPSKAHAARAMAEAQTERLVRVLNASVRGGLRFGGLAAVFYAVQVRGWARRIAVGAFAGVSAPCQQHSARLGGVLAGARPVLTCQCCADAQRHCARHPRLL